MLSLFTKQKLLNPQLLKLPSFCTPTEELSSLAAKRDAQLNWMRQKGMRYLGDPLKELGKRPQRPQPGPAKRLNPPSSPAEEKSPPAPGQSEVGRAA